MDLGNNDVTLSFYRDAVFVTHTIPIRSQSTEKLPKIITLHPHPPIHKNDLDDMSLYIKEGDGWNDIPFHVNPDLTQITTKCGDILEANVIRTIVSEDAETMSAVVSQINTDIFGQEQSLVTGITSIISRNMGITFSMPKNNSVIQLRYKTRYLSSKLKYIFHSKHAKYSLGVQLYNSSKDKIRARSAHIHSTSIIKQSRRKYGQKYEYARSSNREIDDSSGFPSLEFITEGIEIDSDGSSFIPLKNVPISYEWFYIITLDSVLNLRKVYFATPVLNVKNKAGKIIPFAPANFEITGGLQDSIILTGDLDETLTPFDIDFERPNNHIRLVVTKRTNTDLTSDTITFRFNLEIQKLITQSRRLQIIFPRFIVLNQTTLVLDNNDGGTYSFNLSQPTTNKELSVIYTKSK